MKTKKTLAKASVFCYPLLMFITLLIPDSIEILKEPWYRQAEWWAAIATFLAVIIALFGERFWEWLRRPKLHIEFDKESERCFRWAISPEEYRQDQGLFYSVRIWYFRLKVVNTGSTNIKGLIAKVDLYILKKIN